MDEIGWLPAGGPAFLRQHPPRHLAQLAVDERRQLLERVVISSAPGLEQVGQVGCPGHVGDL